MHRNEHLVVVMLESVPAGVEFELWPLHITLVPWFPVRDEVKLDKVLSSIAIKHSPVTAKVGEVTMFGPRRDIPVSLLTNDGDLFRLHWNVFQTLENNGFHIQQQTHLGQNYRAHITHQDGQIEPMGESLRIDNFTLVRQYRQKETGAMIKSVVRDYELG